MNFSLNRLHYAFPRSDDYRLGMTAAGVCETPATARQFPYSERHLQCLWADPRHRPVELKTTEGEAVVVEHPGDWNLEAGPDFLNAVLRVGKEERRICGDLEIHIHANGWHQHGHADDPRYENVRFHIVYFQGIEIPGLMQLPLQPVLSTDPLFSFENIDLTAYPYSIPAGDFPLKEMHPDDKIALLESAGEERLFCKAERLMMAMQTKEPQQVLWEELMAALGYKNNKVPFRRLAVTLPLSRLRARAADPETAYALLLGLSGLLPIQPDPAWTAETRRFIRRIWDIWWKQPDEVRELGLNRSDWALSGIRPANHPVRRLMAAAHYAFTFPMAVHPEGDTSSEPIDLTAGSDSASPSNHEWLTKFPDHFWTRHISWNTRCTPTALVGQARANAMITNILIPFQAALGHAVPDLENLPVEPMNRIIRQTAHALFGPDHTPKVYRSALARQGLIRIFHDYLVTHRLDELKDRFGGETTPLPEHGEGNGSDKKYANDEDIVPPHSNNQPEKTGGSASPLSAKQPERATTDDGDIVPPHSNKQPAQAGGPASPLPTKQSVRAQTDDGDIVPPYPKRKHPAHHPPLERHNKPIIIFLTVCTQRKRNLLDHPHVHEAVRDAWNKADHWIVGRYVIMPNHIHLFCSPNRHNAVGVADWTRYWKRLASQQLPDLCPMWQRGCWDSQLRGHESYTQKWEYVRNNPVRAGLVSAPDEWPYQGTLRHLPW